MKAASAFVAAVAVLWTAAFSVAGCSKPAPAPAEPTRPSAAQSPSSVPPDCDMQGMDMSKMSAEEHKKMMEDCEKAKAARQAQ